MPPSCSSDEAAIHCRDSNSARNSHGSAHHGSAATARVNARLAAAAVVDLSRFVQVLPSGQDRPVHRHVTGSDQQQDGRQRHGDPSAVAAARHVSLVSPSSSASLPAFRTSAASNHTNCPTPGNPIPPAARRFTSSAMPATTSGPAAGCRATPRHAVATSVPAAAGHATHNRAEVRRQSTGPAGRIRQHKSRHDPGVNRPSGKRQPGAAVGPARAPCEAPCARRIGAAPRQRRHQRHSDQQKQDQRRHAGGGRDFQQEIVRIGNRLARLRRLVAGVERLEIAGTATKPGMVDDHRAGRPPVLQAVRQ